MHTPGPWRVRELRDLGRRDVVGYAVDFNEAQEQVVDYVYEETDAYLIAAAPDLLKALEDLLAGYSAYAPNDGWPDKRQRQAIEAIAKARGKA